VRKLRAGARDRASILVVEDDPDLQWRLARHLTVFGNRVVGTGSADGALALIAEWPVDIVLIDQDLPGTTGLELARQIRVAQPDIAIVIMTDTELDERPALGMAGAVSWLAKPFRAEALAEVLARLLPSHFLPGPAMALPDPAE
jgi:CheY-like chemotaxis protein